MGKIYKMRRRNVISVFFALWKYNKRISINLFINYYLFKIWMSKNKKPQKLNSAKKIKKVIFLLGRGAKAGLADVKGFQPRNALRKKGIHSEVYLRKLPRDIDENTLIIFVKYFPFREIKRAIRKKCVLVYEILDEHKPFFLENEGALCDGVIFPNERMIEDFKHLLSKRTIPFVIYHHWDPKFKKSKKKQKKFSLAYFGSQQKKNALYFDKIFIPVFTKFSDHLKYKDKFNCLYSMRKEDLINFLYKPSTKVVTAAAIGANIISSREPSAVELLGKDYPYFTSTDFNSVKKTVEYAKRTFNKKVWKDALKQMEEVRKRTDINIIVNDYISIINHFKK